MLAGHLLGVDHSSGGDFESEGAPAFLVRGARHFIGAQILEIEGSAHGEFLYVGGPEAVDAVVDMAAHVGGVVAGEGVGGKGVGGEGVAFEAESFVDLAEVIADLGVERGAPGRFDELFGVFVFVFAEEDPAVGIPGGDEELGFGEGFAVGFRSGHGGAFLLEAGDGAARGIFGHGEIEAGFAEGVGGVVEQLGIVGAVEDGFGDGGSFFFAVEKHERIADLDLDVAFVGILGGRGLQGFERGVVVVGGGLERGEIEGKALVGVLAKKLLEGLASADGVAAVGLLGGERTDGEGVLGVSGELLAEVGDGFGVVALEHGNGAVHTPQIFLVRIFGLDLIEDFFGTAQVSGAHTTLGELHEVGGGGVVGGGGFGRGCVGGQGRGMDGYGFGSIGCGGRGRRRCGGFSGSGG